MTPRAILPAALCVLLAGCDTVGLGYVNKLRQSVRVVEHGWEVAQPFTLQPGGVKEVGFGHVAESMDILRADGKLLGHYRTRDLPRIGQGPAADYVIITPDRVLIEQRDSLR